MTRQTQSRPEPAQPPTEHVFTIRPDNSSPQDLTQESFVDYEAQAVMLEFRAQLERAPSSPPEIAPLLNSVRSREIREYLLDALLTSEPKIFADPQTRVACFKALTAYSADPDVMFTAAQEFSRNRQCRQSCNAAYELLAAGDLTSTEKAFQVVTQVVDNIQANSVDYSPGQEYALKALDRFPTKQLDEYEQLEQRIRSEYRRGGRSGRDEAEVLKTNDPRSISFLCDIAEGKVPWNSSTIQNIFNSIVPSNSSRNYESFKTAATYRLAELLPDERAEKIVLNAARLEASHIGATSSGWSNQFLRDRTVTPIIQTLVESKNQRAASVLVKLIGDRDFAVKAIALAAASRIENPSDELRKAIAKAHPSVITKICDLAEGKVFPSMNERIGSCRESLLNEGLPGIVPGAIVGAFIGIFVAAWYHSSVKMPSDAADLRVWMITAASLALTPILYSLSYLLPLRRSEELLGLQGQALRYLASDLSSERAKQIVLKHSGNDHVIEILAKSATPEAQSALTQLIQKSDESTRFRVLTAVAQLTNPTADLRQAVNGCKRDVSARITETAIKVSRAFDAATNRTN